MKSKFFSRRALVLHLCLFFWLAMTATAAWWQVGRAINGNSLSFLYAIEWPCFGVLGFLGWYAMLSMDRVSEEQETARREYEQNMRERAAAARKMAREQEDPALAAYNDHLAEIGRAPKKKLWGH